MNITLTKFQNTRTALFASPLSFQRLQFGAKSRTAVNCKLRSYTAVADIQLAKTMSRDNAQTIPETHERYGFTRRRKDAWSEQDIADLSPALRPDHAETLDLILRKKIYLLQSRRGYRANTDSQLLAYFAWSRIRRSAVAPKSALRVLDMGAGNGLVSILFGRAYGDCQIHQIELQGQLADRAARNLQLNDMQGTVFRHDLADGLPSKLRHSVDAVLMNPPFYQLQSRTPPRRREKLLAHMETSADIAAFVNAAAAALAPGAASCPPRVFIIYDVREMNRLFRAVRGAGLRVEAMQRVKHSEDEQATRVMFEAVPRGGDDNAAHVSSKAEHDFAAGCHSNGNYVLPTLCLHPPGCGLYKYNDCMEEFLAALPMPRLKIGQLR